MADQISPLAQLFRGMADLIDHDHTSQTDYEAITKAAAVLAARATTQQLVAGSLWEADGASLLAAAYAFHAGLPRQAATATTSGRSSRRAQRRPRVATTPLQAIRPRPGQATLQVGSPSRFRQQAHGLPQWTQSVCPALPFTVWTQPMRPSCGPPCPSSGGARSSHAASSSG
jgi:type II secretory pathway component HofQ